jgi:hypothetical protein
MPRRFALALLVLLVLLLVAFVLGRKLKSNAGGTGLRPTPTARPTAVVPPTPIAERKVSVFFEGLDEAFHPEARELPASSDDIAFLRSIASAVLEGPRRPELLRPFPEGWTLRGAYRMRDGLVVLDLAPPAASEEAPASRWETGSHEEWSAAQTLAVTVAKNLPDVTRLVLLVGGEAVETLAGHVDLTHPFAPDLARAKDEPPLEPPPPTPTPAVVPATPPGAPMRPAPTPTRPATRRPAADLA